MSQTCRISRLMLGRKVEMNDGSQREGRTDSLSYKRKEVLTMKAQEMPSS